MGGDAAVGTDGSMNGGYTFSDRSVKVRSFIQSSERESVSCSVNLVFSELCSLVLSVKIV